MNRNNQKKEATQDKKYSTKEDTMKTTEKITSRIKRVCLFITLAGGLLVIVLGLITQPLLAEAKSRISAPRSTDQIVERLTDRLDLTAEQVEAIQPIIEEKVQKMNEIREKGGWDRREVRTEIQSLKGETEKKLGEILTDEQFEKYLELRQGKRDRMHRGKTRGSKMRGGINRTPEQIISRLTDRLDLTEEQAAQIEPIIKESMKKRQEVFDKYRDQGLKARESIRNEMQTIGDEAHTRLSTILTDKQIEEFLAIEEKRRARMEKRMNRPGSKGF
jgi:Spy/CpxP family protein refolding chaperone